MLCVCICLCICMYNDPSHVPTVLYDLAMSGLAVADHMATDVARVTQDSLDDVEVKCLHIH